MAPSPAGRRPFPAAFRAALLVLVVLVLAGCGQLLGTEPPATPTDFPGLTGRMKLAGIVLDDWVSGDAGCADPDLVPASISFNASGLDQATPSEADSVKLLTVHRAKGLEWSSVFLVGVCAEKFPVTTARWSGSDVASCVA